MSGRVRHTLPDGRRVIGYRKTAVQRAPRTPPHLLPDWVLSFDLPAHIGGLLLPESYPSVIGVSVGPGSHVEIRGKNKAWLFEQAVSFLRKVALDGLIRPIDLDIHRVDEPPLRERSTRRGALQIMWNGRNATLIHGPAMRPLTLRSNRYGQALDSWRGETSGRLARHG